MDIARHVLLAFWSGAAFVAPVIAVLAMVVCVHEFGHFRVARWRGVKVETFSFGMGRELLGFTDRRGTRWRISALPLGGYVRFLGDGDAAGATKSADAKLLAPAERRTTLAGQPIWARAAIVAAGPIANFLLAILIFATLSYCLGEVSVAPRVERIIPGSAAERAGFQKGDLIRSIDGEPITSFAEIVRFVALRPGESMVFVVARDGADVTLTATPAMTAVKTPMGMQRQGQLGVGKSTDPKDVRIAHPNPLQAVWSGVTLSATIIKTNAEYVWRLTAGRVTADQLSGPIRISEVSHAAAAAGFAALAGLAGMLSLSLGLMNLLPVPMLDGGHLLFCAVEAARGRPLSRRGQEISLRIGLALVGALTIFVAANDLRLMISA